jgi:hypothetical protein
MSGQQRKYKIGYINRAQHKPSARVKPNITDFSKAAYT